MSFEDLYPGLGTDQLGEDKEIKVRIPMQQHIQLHTLKVLRGQSISTTVKAALEAYFVGLAAAPGPRAAQERLEAWTPEAALQQERGP